MKFQRKTTTTDMPPPKGQDDLNPSNSMGIEHEENNDD